MINRLSTLYNSAKDLVLQEKAGNGTIEDAVGPTRREFIKGLSLILLSVPNRISADETSKRQDYGIQALDIPYADYAGKIEELNNSYQKFMVMYMSSISAKETGKFVNAVDSHFKHQLPIFVIDMSEWKVNEYFSWVKNVNRSLKLPSYHAHVKGKPQGKFWGLPHDIHYVLALKLLDRVYNQEDVKSDEEPSIPEDTQNQKKPAKGWRI